MDEMAGKGFCRFCGQSRVIYTVGEMQQAELDDMATEQCTCAGAEADRREKNRKEKVNKYVQKHFDPELRNLIYGIIPMVEQKDLLKVTLALPDDRTTNIWLDSDDYLRIKVKKTSEEELKA